MRKVDITFTLSPKERDIVLKSLMPEMGRTVPKTQVNISETNAGILLTIEAETTGALRAAINSYLRWLDCIFSINNTIKI
jgi:tRNA threonylcarbamoyladenosine modification (KEOPS) complex  Pcc1 subunit